MSIFNLFEKKPTIRKACRHDAIDGARHFYNEFAFDVRIMLGKKRGQEHAQAQALCDGQWQWISFDGKNWKVSNVKDAGFEPRMSEPYDMESFNRLVQAERGAWRRRATKEKIEKAINGNGLCSIHKTWPLDENGDCSICKSVRALQDGTIMKVGAWTEYVKGGPDDPHRK